MSEMPTISQSYGQDHDRLDTLWTQFQSVMSQDALGAAAHFREFRTGLLRHIEWEERLLFPMFEAKTGMGSMGPTEVMRQEHQQIQQLLGRIAQALERSEPSTQTEASALQELLAAHNWKEEHILYPAIDQHLTEAERREILARMEQTT